MEPLLNLNPEDGYKPQLKVVHNSFEDIFRDLESDIETDELFRARRRIEEAYREITSMNKDLVDSINYARRIQHAILPDLEVLTSFSGDSFVFYQPKALVSGDFYWFTRYDHKILVAAVDCTGHGVPGAFLSMIGHNLLNEIVAVKDITQPGEILSRLDRSIRKLLKQDREDLLSNDGMDISLVSIDPEENTLEFAGANRPLIILRQDEIISHRGDKFPIGGMFRDAEIKYQNHKISLEKGDMVYLFTDGFADQFGGEDDKKMMLKRFKKLLKLIHTLKGTQQKRVLEKYLENWKEGKEQTDDVLIMGIRI